MDRFALAKAKGADRRDGKHAALKALAVAGMDGPPMWDRVVMTLHFRFPNRRGRDLLNYAAATKSQCDGIVDAGIVTDDKCTVIQRIGAITWSVDKSNPGVTITVSPWTEEQAA